MPDTLRPTDLESAIGRQAAKERAQQEEARQLQNEANRALIRLAENITLKNTPHDRMAPINKCVLELRIDGIIWPKIRNRPEMQKLIRELHPNYDDWSRDDKRKFWAGVRRSVNRVLAQVETLDSR